MKTKKFGKKMELNKTTIANLEDAKMKNALGGGTITDTRGEECGVPPSASCNTVCNTVCITICATGCCWQDTEFC